MSLRWDQMAESEKAAAAELRSLGNEPLTFGAANLSDRARQLQQLDKEWPPDLSRWLQDNLIRTRDGHNVFGDAKVALPGRENHSIEMRSLLAAQLQTRPVWYICGRLVMTGTRYRFEQWRAIEAAAIPTIWPCCNDHRLTYQLGALEANDRLPRYCLTKRTTIRGGSGTPYFVVHAAAFDFGDPFGMNPETEVSKTRRLDPPFWCEACNGLHPLSEHRNCHAGAG